MEEPNGPLQLLDSIESLLKKLKPGGMTLIENESSMGAEMTLYVLSKYAKKMGMSIIIEDVLDIFPLYVKHMEMMGLGIDLNSVEVIKIGGSEDYGKVAGRINVSDDPEVYTRKRRDYLREKKKHLLINPGLERYLAFHNDFSSVYALINSIKSSMDTNVRFNVYIVDVPILENLELNPLPILEDIATSVVHLQDTGEYLDIRFKKSIFTLMYDINRVLVSPKDIVSWGERIGGNSDGPSGVPEER
ncbi:hypothetical protein A3L09_02435 [Thermococcus profundus]|uniref:KaiC-like domain-containing protein n=1 Tax=Thermococcus profundus TaxID=49899 RepID=A0A2Z2M9W9_THEPR|nr:DUF257 family protein [Thermococcus profundus]ASJ02203.1 hypothetical protein A3L09_02435 [Thermococcus profundus]